MNSWRALKTQTGTALVASSALVVVVYVVGLCMGTVDGRQGLVGFGLLALALLFCGAYLLRDSN